MNDGIRFAELLDYNAEENEHWKKWFTEHTDALELPVDIAEAGSVRGLIAHIFFVEQHFANAVNDSPIDFQQLKQHIDSLGHADVNELFNISEEATGKFRAFLERATDKDYAEVVEFGSRMKLSVTKRKLISQALTHSLRHWAQLATALRQQGFKTDWVHDLLLSKAMQ